MKKSKRTKRMETSKARIMNLVQSFSSSILAGRTAHWGSTPVEKLTGLAWNHTVLPWAHYSSFRSTQNNEVTVFGLKKISQIKIRKVFHNNYVFPAFYSIRSRWKRWSWMRCIFSRRNKNTSGRKIRKSPIVSSLSKIWQSTNGERRQNNSGITQHVGNTNLSALPYFLILTNTSENHFKVDWLLKETKNEIQFADKHLNKIKQEISSLLKGTEIKKKHRPRRALAIAAAVAGTVGSFGTGIMFGASDDCGIFGIYGSCQKKLPKECQKMLKS